MRESVSFAGGRTSDDSVASVGDTEAKQNEIPDQRRKGAADAIDTLDSQDTPLRDRTPKKHQLVCNFGNGNTTSNSNNIFINLFFNSNNAITNASSEETMDMVRNIFAELFAPDDSAE